MATAKNSVTKKTTTTAKKKAPVKKTSSTAKKSSTTKKVNTATKKTPVKKTTSVKKSTVASKTTAVKKSTVANKTTAVKKSTVAKKTSSVKKSTPTKKVATPAKKSTSKATTPTKKVVTKQAVKKTPINKTISTTIKKIEPVDVRNEVSKTTTVKNEKIKQQKIKKEVENSFVFLSLFMGIGAMLLVVLHRFTFNVFGFEIMSSIFMLPVVILMSNYITKKIGFDNSIKSILISMLLMAGVIILIDDLLRRDISALDIAANLISFFVSMLINLSIYYYIISNIEQKRTTYLIFLNYVFTIIVYQIVYMMFISKLSITGDFWMNYFIMIIIGGVISAFLAIFDGKIKRGI